MADMEFVLDRPVPRADYTKFKPGFSAGKKEEEEAARTAEIERKFEEFRNRKGRSHPCYSTSSSVHGAMPKGAEKAKPSPFGKSCKFSDMYVGPHSKSEGLVTGLDKSRVHKAFDQSFG